MPRLTEQYHLSNPLLRSLYKAQVRRGDIKDCFWLWSNQNADCKRSYRSWIRDVVERIKPSKKSLRIVTHLAIALISIAKTFVVINLSTHAGLVLGFVFAFYLTRVPMIAAYSPFDLLGILILGCATLIENRKTAFWLLTLSTFLTPFVYPVTLAFAIWRERNLDGLVLVIPGTVILLSALGFYQTTLSVDSVGVQILSFAFASVGNIGFSILALVIECTVRGFRDPLSLALVYVLSITLIKYLRG